MCTWCSMATSQGGVLSVEGVLVREMDVFVAK